MRRWPRCSRGWRHGFLYLHYHTSGTKGGLTTALMASFDRVFLLIKRSRWLKAFCLFLYFLALLTPSRGRPLPPSSCFNFSSILWGQFFALPFRQVFPGFAQTYRTASPFCRAWLCLAFFVLRSPSAEAEMGGGGVGWMGSGGGRQGASVIFGLYVISGGPIFATVPNLAFGLCFPLLLSGWKGVFSILTVPSTCV